MINRPHGQQHAVESRPARDWDRSGKRFGSTEKAREKLGFAASVPVAEGLERTVEWTRRNRSNILRTMTAHARFVPEVLRYAGDTGNGGDSSGR